MCAPDTDVTYSVQTIDQAGNLSVPSAGVTTHTAFLPVAAGSVWKYLDNGSNQGTAWRANGFNDASWASGPAQLGYGDGDEATVVGYGPSANAKYLTTYFRRGFTIGDPSSISALTLNLLRDDGAVVYLNGTEVARSNMPTGHRVVDHTRARRGGRRRGIAVVPVRRQPVPALTSGTNTIAVEIHQNNGSSSDISFDLSLSAVGTTAPPPRAGPDRADSDRCHRHHRRAVVARAERHRAPRPATACTGTAPSSAARRPPPSATPGSRAASRTRTR